MKQLKCFWCSGRTKVGVHSKCWQVFCGFMLSDRVTADTCVVDNENGDEYLPNGDTYSRNGRNIIEGKVMPSVTSE